jgi:hypothetical protein
MKFPDKLDVLAVHARLVSETGAAAGSGTKHYWNPLSPLSKTVSTMKPLIQSHVRQRMPTI